MYVIIEPIVAVKDALRFLLRHGARLRLRLALRGAAAKSVEGLGRHRWKGVFADQFAGGEMDAALLLHVYVSHVTYETYMTHVLT